MDYTIDWIGSVGLGVRTPEGRPLAFSLEENQSIPPEFHEGDEVEILNHPDHPANLAMDRNNGYYEITHVKSGVTLRTWHRADGWRVEPPKPAS